MNETDTLPELIHTPNSLQLFRYSAVTWNPHRIHYDESYARGEGHPGVLMHSHFRAAMAIRAIVEPLSSDYELIDISYRVRKPVVPGMPLRYVPVQTDQSATGIQVELNEVLESGDVGLEATARLTRKTA